MSVQLVAEVTAFLNRDECELTSSERLALYAVADRARDNTRQAWQGGEDDWRLDRIVGVQRLSDVLERLTERGLDIRVVVKTAKNGKPVYAHKGRQVSYWLPPLDAKASDVPEAMSPEPSVTPDDLPSKASDETEACEAKGSDESPKASVVSPKGSDQSHKASDETEAKQSRTVKNSEEHVPAEPDADDGLFEMPTTTPRQPRPRPNETPKQRNYRLACIYTDVVALSKKDAIAGIVGKAFADKYTEQQIADGLQKLVDEGRTVTANTLKIAIDGFPVNGSRPVKRGGYAPRKNPTDQEKAYSGFRDKDPI